MKLIFVITLYLATSIVLKSQGWSYKEGEDPFDGKFTTASVVGLGESFPYNKPLFVVNMFRSKTDDPNVYVASVPCACCDNLQVKIKFDAEKNIYDLKATTNESKEVWFLKFGMKDNVYWDEEKKAFVDYDTGEVEKGEVAEFIEDLKAHSKMYVRLVSDCTKYNCEFSLSGSTSAINFVMKK